MQSSQRPAPLPGTPPGPRLQVKPPPHDLHAFGASRFHRSMGPAVGLVKMVENRMPRRHTPPMHGNTPCLVRHHASAPDFHNLCHKVEIENNGLEAAALSSGFGHCTHPNARSPSNGLLKSYMSISSTMRKRSQRSKSPRESGKAEIDDNGLDATPASRNFGHSNVSRPSSGRCRSYSGNSSTLKRPSQLIKSPRDALNTIVDLEDSGNKVRVPPLTCVLAETISPKAPEKSPDVQRSCLTGYCHQAIPSGNHYTQIDGPLASNVSLAVNFPTMQGGTSPEHWRRAQKKDL